MDPRVRPMCGLGSVPACSRRPPPIPLPLDVSSTGGKGSAQWRVFKQGAGVVGGFRCGISHIQPPFNRPDPRTRTIEDSSPSLNTNTLPHCIYAQGFAAIYIEGFLHIFRAGRCDRTRAVTMVYVVG